jgi:hypothetical protein
MLTDQQENSCTILDELLFMLLGGGSLSCAEDDGGPA